MTWCVWLRLWSFQNNHCHFEVDRFFLPVNRKVHRSITSKLRTSLCIINGHQHAASLREILLSLHFYLYILLGVYELPTKRRLEPYATQLLLCPSLPPDLTNSHLDAAVSFTYWHVRQIVNYIYFRSRISQPNLSVTGITMLYCHNSHTREDWVNLIDQGCRGNEESFQCFTSRA